MQKASKFTAINRLLPWLQWVDQLINRAINLAPSVYGEEISNDAFRGLRITDHEAQRLLKREPGSSLFGQQASEDLKLFPKDLPIPSRLKRLADAFSLSQFDIGVLFIALVPELDLKYERLYAYLQDDVNKKRPCVDLALNLLSSNASEKLQRRNHFLGNSPLFQHNLICLFPGTGHEQSSLLSCFLKVDDLIIAYLLEEQGLDRRISFLCDLSYPDTMSSSQSELDGDKEDLPALAQNYIDIGKPLWLYFQGPDNASKKEYAGQIAGRLNKPFLYVNLARLGNNSTEDVARICKLIIREAWLKEAILYFDNYDVLRASKQANIHQQFMDQVSECCGITVLSGIESWVSEESGLRGMILIKFDIPDYSQRMAHWKKILKKHTIQLSKDEIDNLTGRYRLTANQIVNVVETAFNEAQLQSVGYPNQKQEITLSDLFSAARVQTRNSMTQLAQQIKTIANWEDLVLPEDTLIQLREISAHYIHRPTVHDTWGFGRKLSYGKGINVLFTGSSGTGKTMAAEVLANHLAFDLFKIDLSGIVSKYIGETEKNLDKIFTAAENANVILFFDEADALFGKRSEIRDSHDRYANLEVSYLLQKMEQYDGIAILATNLRENMDEAFVRRLAFIVHFPFPDEACRRQIWEKVWPEETPLSEDIDLDNLASQLKLSGGNIKNVALAAAFMAADSGQVVTYRHILDATQREYQKLGKAIDTIVE